MGVPLVLIHPTNHGFFYEINHPSTNPPSSGPSQTSTSPWTFPRMLDRAASLPSRPVTCAGAAPMVFFGNPLTKRAKCRKKSENVGKCGKMLGNVGKLWEDVRQLWEGVRKCGKMCENCGCVVVSKSHLQLHNCGGNTKPLGHLWGLGRSKSLMPNTVEILHHQFRMVEIMLSPF